MGSVNNRGIKFNKPSRENTQRKLKTDWSDAGVEKSLDPGGGMGKVFNGGLPAVVRTDYCIFTLCRRSPPDIRGYQSLLQTNKPMIMFVPYHANINRIKNSYQNKKIMNWPYP